MGITLQKTQVFFLYLFIGICVILPTGSVFGVNVKMIVLGFVILLCALDKKIIKITVYSIIPLLLVALALIYSSIMGVDTSDAVNQSKDILTLIIMPILCASIIDRENYFEVVGLIVKCVCFVGVLKILAFVIGTATGLGPTNIVMYISDVFGIKLMTLDNESLGVSRINFTSDYIIPFCLFYLMQKNITGGGGKLAILILLVSSLFSLSRFIWVGSILGFSLPILTNTSKLKSIFFIVIFALTSVYASTLQYVQDLIEFRFNSVQSDSSDIERKLQGVAIFNDFWKSPLFGNGIGYHIPNLVRSGAAPYSYELQVQALLMQIGIIGVLLISFYVFFILTKGIKDLKFSHKISFFSLMVIWVSSGFFNPVLVSSTGGIAYLMLYAMPVAMLYRSKGVPTKGNTDLHS